MYTFSKNQRIGYRGECWAVEQLQHRGFTVRFDPDFRNEGYDLVVNGLPTEVKIANRTKRKKSYINRAGLVVENWYDRWQWHISPTSTKIADWLLILVADVGRAKYPYIVPGGIVLDRTHIQLTSHPSKYNGWLAQWLNRWEIIEYLANGIYKDGGPLFEQWSERIAD